MKKQLFLLLALFFVSFYTIAQEVAVGAGDQTGCEFFLVDNGLSASDYGPNENSEMTICHDGSDQPLVNLYFAFFNLGAGDQLSIYDGNSTSAPLIGTYTGVQIQSQNITSTNTDGCLTVVFTSDGDGSVGSFGAEVSCEPPCIRPFAIITTSESVEDPIRICVGEEVTFDGSSSTFAEGVSLATWEWDFDDGATDNASWPSVTHSFAEPGAYIVQLHLTDDNECNSANLPDKLIFVATEPDFTLSADDNLVCVGQEVNLTGAAAPVTWTSLPEANFGGALFIPDDQSECFSSELIFSQFAPGAVVEDVNDILNFFINFEHSFMGDLVITFICPNGQALVVHDQGGSGTFLGEPVDNDSDLEPGIGYDYYWSPTATNGTWADNAGGTLPSGTYESSSDFSALLGCPLNGAWTVELCDMWGSDNGFIFDWSVNFDPSLYPDLITFTPSIGLGCDSTFWNGSFITETSADCNQISAVPTAPGTYTYTYTANDNHGCTYTSSVDVVAYPGPIPSAGADLIFCGEPVTLEGEVTNPVSGISYVYSWSPTDPLNASSAPVVDVVDLDETTDFILSVYPSDDPNCLVRDTANVFIPAVPASYPLDSLEFCLGGGEVLESPFFDSQYAYTWNYSLIENDPSGEFLSNSNFIYAEQTGYYTVQIAEPVCGFYGTAEYFAEVFPCEIKIPNIFSPNNDNYNNSFEIYGLDHFPGSTIQIWNRWGKLMYESSNYYNQWAPNEDEAADGVYFYLLGVNKPDGMEYFEGHITLTRKK
jgi:gliding motility-associated-like protein